MDAFISYINIHTHRGASASGEWVLRSFRAGELEAAPGSRTMTTAWSAGIHPWDANSDEVASWIDLLQVHLREGRLWAIGEIGLDRSRGVPLDRQMEVFEQQIGLAEEYRLPVILHCVKAHSDLLAFQKAHHIKVPMIVHGFRGKTAMANDLIRAGFHLSFGAAILNASGAFAEMLKAVPERNFFLETDEDKACIADIYTKMAGIRGMDPEALKQQQKKNWNKLIASKDAG